MTHLKKFAALATALIVPLGAWAVQPSAAKRASKTIQMLQADPLLVHTLEISDDDKNALMNEVIKASQNTGVPKQNQNDGLIQKANFFEDLFGLNQPEQPPPRPVRPKPDYGAIKMPTSPAEPAIVFDHASMSDPNDWKVLYFDVVIVINKARSGQNVHVYQKIDGGMPELVMNGAKISTGREIPELSNADRMQVGLRTSDHAPKYSYFSNTPTGYFTPILFSIDHVSSDWEGAAMDHAVFFHERGIATHKAPGGTEGQLGRRASGACVRMTKSDARDLFWLVRRTGGPVTPNEMSGGNFERSSPGPSFANELVAEQAKGFNTYEATPDIPVFDRRGNLKFEEDGITPVMRKALARTLIVVESREVVRVSKAAPAPQ